MKGKYSFQYITDSVFENCKIIGTRPRRFGKTLAMSMLSEFFDIKKDSKDLFRGLLIAEEEAVCKSWMNQYPTLFLSFKSVDGLDFAKAYEKLAAVLADAYKEHIYLLEDDKLDTFNRELFCQVASGKASPGMMENSLFNLMKMMQAYYGKPVILLMDEYDVPLAKASDNGYYREMRSRRNLRRCSCYSEPGNQRDF